MTIAVLNYTLQITRLIRKARMHGVVTRPEADYLGSMAHCSSPADATRKLIGTNGSPDFLYAALHFATQIWQMGDFTDNDEQARAGYLLARFVLSQEAPGYNPTWASKLLLDLYDAHAESMPGPVDYVTRRTAFA